MSDDSDVDEQNIDTDGSELDLQIEELEPRVALDVPESTASYPATNMCGYGPSS